MNGSCFVLTAKGMPDEDLPVRGHPCCLAACFGTSYAVHLKEDLGTCFNDIETKECFEAVQECPGECEAVVPPSVGICVSQIAQELSIVTQQWIFAPSVRRHSNCPNEVSFVYLGANDTGAFQASLLQECSRKIGPLEVGSTKIGSREMSVR